MRLVLEEVKSPTRKDFEILDRKYLKKISTGKHMQVDCSDHYNSYHVVSQYTISITDLGTSGLAPDL